MHPDLSAHLHTEECNNLIQKLIECHENNPFKKFLGECNDIDRFLGKCLHNERIARRARNLEQAKLHQKLVKERIEQEPLV